MAIVWILEKPGKNEKALAVRVQGDFAVRCFASLRSLLYLARIDRPSKPDLILVDCRDYFDMTLANLQSSLELVFTEAIRIFFSPAHAIAKQSDLDYELSFCQLEQLPFIMQECLEDHRSIRSSEPLTSLGRQNLGSTVFDYESLALHDKLTGERIALPLKEGKILKLMLEFANDCVTRQKIMDEIWPNLAISGRTIDSHISRLRSRISPLGLVIENRYGSGYVLRLQADCE